MEDGERVGWAFGISLLFDSIPCITFLKTFLWIHWARRIPGLDHSRIHLWIAVLEFGIQPVTGLAIIDKQVSLVMAKYLMLVLVI